jgi:hypothetical protein
VKAQTADPEVQNLYLRGRGFEQQRTREGLSTVFAPLHPDPRWAELRKRVEPR